MSGGGKSYAVRRLLEQLYMDMPAIVVDREGEFFTLREQLDYFLAGGHGSDEPIPTDPHEIESLAERILQARMHSILDVEPLDNEERQEFMREFLTGLIEAPKALRGKPILVVIDEAHFFAPQVGSPQAKKAMHRLASLGRKRGLVPIFATQRLSEISKTVAAECHNRMIGMATLDVDVRRACGELGFSSARRDDLRNLRPGEFFVYGPAFGSSKVKLVKVAAAETSHPSPGEPYPEVPGPGTNAIHFTRNHFHSDRPQPSKVVGIFSSLIRGHTKDI